MSACHFLAQPSLRTGDAAAAAASCSDAQRSFEYCGLDASRAMEDVKGAVSEPRSDTYGSSTRLGHAFVSCDGLCRFLCGTGTWSIDGNYGCEGMGY